MCNHGCAVNCGVKSGVKSLGLGSKTYIDGILALNGGVHEVLVAEGVGEEALKAVIYHVKVGVEVQRNDTAGCHEDMPILTGVLRDSGPLSTEIGSGLVVYNTPYAKKQYYENNGGDGLAGRLWFERAKADHLGDWADVVEKTSGGKVKLL